MRTDVGVGQEREEAGKGLVSKGRVLLAYSLAGALFSVVVAGDSDVGQANPVQLASYNPAGDFVVLSLKDSSAIPSMSRQRTLSTGYDVASNLIDLASVTSAVGRGFVSGGFTETISGGAPCRDGRSFNTCSGFMELLDGKEKVLPRFRDEPLPAVLEPVAVVASLGGEAGLSGRITASMGEFGAAVPSRTTVRAPIGSKVAHALTSQAACMTGAMFDACPGFMDVLHSRQQAWPEFTRASSPAAGKPLNAAGLRSAIVASASETVNLATGTAPTSFDRPEVKAGEVIIGTASTYNPYDKEDNDAGGAETASGELYNPIAWTAAIQIKLRDKFAGVRYGRLYTPSFALIEMNGKRAIVKINDVGPLRPGRVIDLSTQAMRYFDSTLQRGILDGMLVTPLIGAAWTPGPLGTAPMIAVASSGP